MTRSTAPKRARKVMGGVISIIIALIGLAVLAAVAGAGGIGEIGAAASQGACRVLPSLGIECDLGTVPRGASATVEIVVPAEVSGVLKDVALVRGNEPDSNPADNEDVEETTVVGAVELVITKTASPSPAVLGKPLVYSVTVENKGPSTATQVSLTDTLPFGVSVQSFRTSRGECSRPGFAIRCEIGSLRRGETVQLDVVVVPEATGFVTNRACVSSREDDPCATTLTEITAPAIPTPTPPPPPPTPAPASKSANLSVEKSDKKDPVRVGDNITYIITVTNTGPDDATGVILSDKLEFKAQE